MQELLTRSEIISNIEKLAETQNVRNQAFFGLKGVGKTTILQEYFTVDRIKNLTALYKNIFVYTMIDHRKTGEDFYFFLLEQVIAGIKNIADEKDRDELSRKVDVELKNPYSTESKLKAIINDIKTREYRFILVMDHFHCMARDSEIGQDQYETLRSFNQQNQMYYWIATDTSLIDQKATEQYRASFFEQNFTSKMTICPMPDSEAKAVIRSMIDNKGIRIEDCELDFIYQITGGVPKFISMIVDMIPQLQIEYDSVNEESIEFLLETSSCISLMKSWSDGLSNEQKRILLTIAVDYDGTIQKEYLASHSIQITKLGELANDSGRGLLTSIKDEFGRRWEIAVPLYKEYLKNIGDRFIEQEETIALTNSYNDVQTNVTNIVNNFYGETNYIQNQTKNTINIENAISGLENLQRLINSNGQVLGIDQISQSLEYLPFQQEAWIEMDEEQQEEEITKYANGIFQSNSFSNGSLTAEQQKRFNLSDETLAKLSDECRTQIVCGIQVYDLIQYCIDNFGLEMKSSESPRAILFARAFEKHMKDCMYTLFGSMDVFNFHKIKNGRKGYVKLSDYPVNRTTIGTYTTMIENAKPSSYGIFASLSVGKLGYTDKNITWWETLVEKLCKIGDLRNKCCHSGSDFDSSMLNDLITLIFDDASLDDVHILKEIESMGTSVINSNRHDDIELKKKPTNITASAELLQLKKSIENMIQEWLKRNGKTPLPKLKQTIDNKYPSFNVKEYGYSKFSRFVNDINNVVVENNEAYYK